MKFIEPSVEYWQQEAGIQGVWKQIARATRVSYQSSAREGESDLDFVKRVILKPALIEGDLNDLEHCKFDNLKLHGGVLEFGTIYLAMPMESMLPITANDWGKYAANPYSKGFKVCEVNNEKRVAVTSNFRVLIEHEWLSDLQYLCEPTEYHNKRYCFNVVTDIGVTREFNRHRASMSICEESTRYCDYNKDKFGGELTFIKPNWNCNTQDVTWSLGAWLDDNTVLDEEGKLEDFDYYSYALKACEFAYQGLRKQGWKPEQARQVLPLGLKTQACYTAYKEDWLHFLALRADNVSGKVHPNMQVIANKIKEIGQQQKLW